MLKIPSQEADQLAGRSLRRESAIRWTARLLMTACLGTALSVEPTAVIAQTAAAQPPALNAPATRLQPSGQSAVQSAVAERTSQKPLASSEPRGLAERPTWPSLRD
jgi:hypothetical protein